MKRNLLGNILLDADPGASGGGGGGGGAPATITQDDLHKAMEKARIEERTKLNELLAKTKADLEAAIATAKENGTKVADLTQQLDAVTKAQAGDGKGVDLKALIAEVTTGVEKRFSEASKAEREKLQNDMMGLTTEVTTLRLEKLRSQLINEAGGEGKLVLAMIKGDTEEALRASVKASSEAYADIETRIAKANGSGAPQGDGQQRQTPPPVGGAGGQGGAGRGAAEDNLQDVRNLTPAQYRERREKVLAEVGKRTQ
jgi:hypothetical protein